MDIFKTLPILFGIACVTAIAIFGTPELGLSALGILSVILLRPRL